MANSNEDALKQYYNSLIELHQNSKPLISMLTIIAEENINIAEGIVDLIIERIFNVKPDIKLCCLYLIDSICKNIGKDYIELFSKNLVIVFYHIFDKGDHAIRDNLFKTRKTWKGLFRDEILDKLDLEINKLDSKWPVDKKPNLKQQQKESNELLNNNLMPNKLNQLNELPNLQQPQISNQQIPRASILEYVNNKKRQLIGKRSPSPEHKRSPNWNNNQPNSNSFNLNNNNHMKFNSIPSSSNNLTSSTISDFNLNNLANLNNISASNSNIQSTSSLIQAPIQSSFQQQQQLLPQISQNLTNFLNRQMITDNNIPGLNDTRNDKLFNIFNPTQSNLNNINLAPSLNALNQLANLNNTDIDYRFFNNNQVLNQPTQVTATNLALNPQSPEELKLQVDGKIRKLYYLDDHSAIVLMNCIPDLSFDKLKYYKPHELDPRSICFEGPPVHVIIDEKNFISLSFDNQWKIFYHNNFEQKIKFGGPVKEIYLNNQIIQAKFGGPPVLCKLIGDFNDHTLRLGLPAPKVKLSDHSCIELWVELLKKYAPQQSINNLNNNNNFNLNIKQPLYQPLIPPAIAQPLVLPLIAEQTPIISEPLNPQPIIPQTLAPNLINSNLVNPVNPYFVPQSTSSIPLINDPAPIQNGSKVLKEQLNNNNLTSSINDKKEQQQQQHHQTKSKKNKKDKNLKEKDKTSEEPELTLDSASLKIRRQSLIDLLYSGSQCTNCSLRFDNTTDKGKSKYSAHLDWHFRQNRKVRGSNFRTSTRNRDWYLPGDLWLKYKEINMEEENENSKQPTIFELNNPIINDPKDQIDMPLIKANIDDKLNICSICYEKFNQRWCDDEEEWKLENAVLNEDKYYHPSCLNDMLNKSLNEDEITMKDDETTKSEETILRISDSMLENYEPSIVKEEDVNEEEIKLEEKEISNEEKETNESNLKDNESDELNRENEKDSINDKVELMEDTDSQIDTNNLVKKTVLNISDDQMEDEQIKLGNEESEENKTDTDLKVEIIGLNIADKENELTESIDDNNEIVKKIELKPNTKKELKPILLKLKDSNLELVNQRNKELNSPTSDNSKSPVSQNGTNHDYNYLEDPNVKIHDREESALCSIM